MYLKILTSCLLVFFLFGCKKDNPSNVIVDIEDDFYIDMFEDVSTGEQRFQVKVTTIKAQTCLNYQIDHSFDYDKLSNSIELVINDLIEPADCVPGTASTNLTVPFGNIALGTYSFDINLKDAVINTGRLTVFSDHYLMEMNSNDGIEMLHDRLYRIPQNTVWGYVAYDDSADETAAQDVISTLEDLPATTDIEDNGLYKSGFYGYFNLAEDRTVTLESAVDFDHHIPFLFQQDNLNEIQTAIDNACMQNPNIEIQLFNETGLNELCSM